MAESFNYTTSSLPDDCGYNKIFKYQWKTTTYALPMTSVNEIHRLVKKRWGWHFIPHKNMDYSRDDWYLNQTLYLTFENKMDLILAKLLVSVK